MEIQASKIKLIIGLGNPDKDYGKTFHNIGFLFIDYFKQGLKSDAYMNESGKFVSKMMKKNNIKPENLLIAHDDSDIEFGKYKISFGRGSAGHRGVESIIKSLKTKDFWRLRIGIRPPKSKQKAEKLVLKKISKKESEILEKVFENIIICFVIPAYAGIQENYSNNEL